jgi:hypothetical protein
MCGSDKSTLCAEELGVFMVFVIFDPDATLDTNATANAGSHVSDINLHTSRSYFRCQRTESAFRLCLWAIV